MVALHTKRQDGRYYTEGNPFFLEPFQAWMKECGLYEEMVLEPFAGANNLIRALKEVGAARKFASFDIEPAHAGVEERDTIASFPTGFHFCVTNPPWLAKNSATRRGLPFPETEFDDLYKHALDLCLKECRFVAALIPATFLRSELFRERLDAVIFLHNQRMFSDTENPVCLALFSPTGNRIRIFNDNTRVGYLDELERELPEPAPKDIRLTFNAPCGGLGLIAFDSTRKPSIRFVSGETLGGYRVGFTSRMITRIEGDFQNLDGLIDRLNNDIDSFRVQTRDVFLTPFKGLRKDGLYRRRLDYRLARDFIAKHAYPHP